MSQIAALQALDADIAAAFADIGFADAALFKVGGSGPGVACTVYVDRGVQLQSADFGSVSNDQITLSAFIAETIARPKRLDVFVIGSETFTVDSVLQQDESRVVCRVKAGV